MKLTDAQYNSVLNSIKGFFSFRMNFGFELSDQNLETELAQFLTNNSIDYDSDDWGKFITDLEYEYMITHSLGEFIFNDYDFQKWYFNDDVSDKFFWNRYSRFLQQQNKLDSKSIELLDNTTLPDIMNCLFDPKEEYNTKRLKRGLIIGDVQSGKTSTYAGLICKAADAGYKIVILLAGITESLRQQTQERIDEGIVGYSIRLENKVEKRGKVGVGLDNKPQRASAFTTCVKDFVKGSHLISTTLDSQRSLVLFVVKKNVSVLTKLHDWLRDLNMDARTNTINHPMLLIDDEADNASVNTKKDDTDPTKTNAIIRKICNLFQIANYVGFTATPFANVFIDPDSVDSMKNADLFPEHFIYSLPTPSSYIGAEKIFYDDQPFYRNLRFITDIEEPDYESEEYKEDARENVIELNSGPFYYRHKKEWDGILPESLKESIYCFYLANVVRDLRGNSSQPRSMLINMSRFVKVQHVISEHVEKIQKKFIETIRYNFDIDSVKNKSLSLYKALEHLWFKHFDNITDVSFEDVISKKNLLNAVYDSKKGLARIEIMVVNGKSANKLDYKAKPNLRVIAIGGLALSRGLTLEGLLVSYFYRNTATFDVLMQMGRWFGYRRGYEDLFQIWTSKASADWYAEIAKASSELKADIKKMYEQHLTPKDFGIRVRDYCDELQITANNKMRTAYDLLVTESYYGNICDTPYVSTKASHNKNNWEQVNALAQELFSCGYELKLAKDSTGKEDGADIETGKSLCFTDVPKEVVARFLSSINCSMYNMRFNKGNLVDFINDPQSIGLENWDIVFEGGIGNAYYDIPGLESIRCAQRTIVEHDHVIQISTRRRILSMREGKFCLTDEQVKTAETRCRDKWREEDPDATEASIKQRSIPVKAYFEHLPDRKPLLIIMLLQPTMPKEDKYNEDVLKKTKDYIKDLNGDRLVAFAVGFPGVKDCGKSKKYKVNKTYYQLNIQEPDEIEEDEE